MSFNKVLFLAVLVSSSHAFAFHCTPQEMGLTDKKASKSNDAKKPATLWIPSVYEEALYPRTCSIGTDDQLAQKAIAILHGENSEKRDDILYATITVEATYDPTEEGQSKLDNKIYPTVVKAMNDKDRSDLNKLKASIALRSANAKAETLIPKHNDVGPKSLKSDVNLNVTSNKLASLGAGQEKTKDAREAAMDARRKQ